MDAISANDLKTRGVGVIDEALAESRADLDPLKDKFAGLHIVSITMGYRITIEMIIIDREIIPVTMGDHEEVYRQSATAGTKTTRAGHLTGPCCL